MKLVAPAIVPGLLLGALSASPHPRSAAPIQDANAPATSVVLHREGVLGTSMRLEVDGDASRAADVERAVVVEIERLDAILSSWDQGSEFARLPVGETVAASPELCAVLSACESWTRTTRGAFDPRVEACAAVWRTAAERGREPTDEEIATALASVAEPLFEVDEGEGTVRRLRDGRASVDGIAKGFVLDAAARAALGAGATGGTIEIGGDLVAFGPGERSVDLADPAHHADNAPPLCTLVVAERAVATSANYARGFDVGGVHHGHIIDPRTGRPTERVAQATVVAPDAATADALATAFCVMEPRESLRLCERRPGVETLVLCTSGARYETPGFAALVAPGSEAGPAPTSVLAGGGALAVEVELAKFEERDGGRRRGGYRRPYLAAWLEDGRGRPVRTLALWVERPKWIRDLREWSREFEHESDGVRAVTRATRGPGRYTLEYDGRDDAGRPLAAGTYTLLVEAVREHGGHEVVALELVLDGHAFRDEVKGTSEIGAVSASYVAAPDAREGGR
ncbi:MAG: DUF2271 domain-containing protein [Planctomycetota bacterium]